MTERPARTPLLSIVTVTFNDSVGLAATLRSLETLKREAGSDIEILIQDGGSTKVSAELSNRYSTLASFESVADSGIYDGMNRALARSTGRSVWFLNGGDTAELAGWETLAVELRRDGAHMIFADYLLKTRGRELVRKSRKASYIWHGLPTSHQAIFYPGDRVRAEKYDLSYSIVGDYELTARLLMQKVETRNASLVVAAFQSGGISQQQGRLIAIEARQVQQSTLHTSRLSQYASRLRHAVSRLLRRVQTGC